MHVPRIAVISFPGTNGDTENLRAFWRCGFDAFVFRWNDSREKLADVDGYFIGAGFSYEDRGRSGMVAARDPLFRFLHDEAERGKVIVGNCNGAQVLVESGLIPLGDGLRMSLARNAIRASTPLRGVYPEPRRGAQHDRERWIAPGFLNEWVWIKRTCARDRCATSDWEGMMHIPIAHGEGRYVTKDPDLIAALEENDQIAFSYCDAEGTVSEDSSVTLNGSTKAIAGICNPGGNVIALMPHPERTTNGDPYFLSVRKWIESRTSKKRKPQTHQYTSKLVYPPPVERALRPVEIFIDTIIVNNEERTVEQAARRIVPTLKLKQYRYLAPAKKKAEEILTTIALFNPNKEIAYVRENPKSDLSAEARRAKGEIRNPKWYRWNAERKDLEKAKNPLSSLNLVRRDEPDTGSAGLGENSETGICYSLGGISEQNLCSKKLLEIFANPHASILERLY